MVEACGHVADNRSVVSANGSGYPLFTHSGLPLHGGMYSGIPLGHGGLGRLVMEERVGATLIEMQGVRSGGGARPHPVVLPASTAA